MTGIKVYYEQLVFVIAPFVLSQILFNCISQTIDNKLRYSAPNDDIPIIYCQLAVCSYSLAIIALLMSTIGSSKELLQLSGYSLVKNFRFFYDSNKFDTKLMMLFVVGNVLVGVVQPFAMIQTHINFQSVGYLLALVTSILGVFVIPFIERLFVLLTLVPNSSRVSSMLALGFFFTGMSDICDSLFTGMLRGCNWSLLCICAAFICACYAVLVVVFKMFLVRLTWVQEKSRWSLLVFNSLAICVISQGLLLLVLGWNANVSNHLSWHWIILYSASSAMLMLARWSLLRLTDSTAMFIGVLAATVTTNLVMAFISTVGINRSVSTLLGSAFLCVAVIYFSREWHGLVSNGTGILTTTASSSIRVLERENKDDKSDEELALLVSDDESVDKRLNCSWSGTRAGAVRWWWIAVLAIVLYSWLAIVETDIEMLPESTLTSVNLNPYLDSSGFPQTCSIYEVPIEDPRTNLKAIVVRSAKFGRQFAITDAASKQLLISCPQDKISFIGPQFEDSPKGNWHHIQAEDTLEKVVNADSDYSRYSIVPWRTLFSSTIDGGRPWPYVWLRCDDGVSPDVNYVFRPPFDEYRIERPIQLTDSEINRVRKYVELYSNAVTLDSSSDSRVLDATVSSNSSSSKKGVARCITAKGESCQATPLFNNVLVFYFDAVSRVKFKNYFKKSYALLQSLYPSVADSLDKTDGIEVSSTQNKGSIDAIFSPAAATHVAIPLGRLHSLGTNSVKNFPPVFAGVNHDSTAYFKAKFEMYSEKVSSTNHTSTGELRAGWLFDIAESLGYSTLVAHSGCQGRCKANCLERSQKTPFHWEDGGFLRQYMMDTRLRYPSMFTWPGTAECESQFRPELSGRAANTMVGEDFQAFWMGDKYSANYIVDWVKMWLAGQHNSKDTSKTPARSFGVVVFEETHVFDTFDTNVDDALFSLLKVLLFADSKQKKNFGLENLAVLLLADHGMHFGNEFRIGTGKVANKQPFSYIMLPKTFTAQHPTQLKTLLANSKMLVTPYDIRATLLRWLTGRAWGRLHLNNAISRRLPSDDSIVAPVVVAGDYGFDLLTDHISPTRSCSEAGIPSRFCGCNMESCSPNMIHEIQKSFPAIANFMNAKVLATGGENVEDVCRPMQTSDFFLLPGSASDCIVSRLWDPVKIPDPAKLSKVQHVGSATVSDASFHNRSNAAHNRLLEVNIVVTRNNAIVGAYFELNDNDKLTLVDVNTISRYSHQWEKCKKELLATGRPLTLHDSAQQFCYCRSAGTIEGALVKFLSYIL